MYKKIIFSIVGLIFLNASMVMAADRAERTERDIELFRNNMLSISSKLEIPEEEASMRISQIIDDLSAEGLSGSDYLNLADCQYIFSYFGRQRIPHLIGGTGIEFLEDTPLRYRGETAKLLFVWEYLNKVRPLVPQDFLKLPRIIEKRNQDLNHAEIRAIFRVLRYRDDYHNHSVSFMYFVLKEILTDPSGLSDRVEGLSSEKDLIDMGQILANYYQDDFTLSSTFLNQRSKKMQVVLQVIRFDRIRKKFLNYAEYEISSLISELKNELHFNPEQKVNKKRRIEI